MKIAVIGSGGWGLAMAKCMVEAGHSLSVWSHKPETTAMLREKRCNPKLLRGIAMPEGIAFTDDLSCVQGCPIVVLAVPSFAVCETAQKLSPLLEEGQALVLLSKGGKPFAPKDNKLLFYVKNAGKLIFLRDTKKTRTFVETCYGPLDFDLLEEKK